MTAYVAPWDVEWVRTFAQTKAAEECDCRFADDVHEMCDWHTVLGVLQPTVEAHEAVF
jgi:hypothetical protein